jgi:hypothetical protein
VQSGASASSQYWTAAADGSKVLFTAVKPSNSVSDLYEFSVDSRTTHRIARMASGVVGASEDASLVYFVSREDRDGSGAAEAGKPNLYLYKAGQPSGEGTYTFIATLAEADAGSVFNLVSPQSSNHFARVSADGAHLAFMSFASLTGYDNTDVASGHADAEVFVYDATTGQLHCASCNPSGARPLGRDERAEGAEFWIAGQIPGWQNNLYASRVLSADGSRLYFESTDALSSRDTNARQDVYQWETPGAGDCDVGDTSFSPRNDGCLSLISSGQSERDSEFRDADPDGSDVFFATLSSLLPQDYGLVDIYDARVGGGLPTPAPLQPPCEGDACQNPAPAPARQTPSSSSYRGPGNIRPAPPKPRCPKGKHRVQRKGKSRCVAKRGKNRKHSTHRRPKGKEAAR